jgi:hypothetical protein
MVIQGKRVQQHNIGTSADRFVYELGVTAAQGFHAEQDTAE